MEFFNVSIGEILLILLIALIVLGPENMVKTARDIGRAIARFLRSPAWSQMMETSRELRELPTRLVRDAGLEETMAEIDQESRTLNGQLDQEFRIDPPALQNRRAQHRPEQKPEKDRDPQTIPEATPGDSTPGPMIETEPPEGEDFEGVIPDKESAHLPGPQREVEPPDEDDKILPDQDEEIETPVYGSNPSEAGPEHSPEEEKK